MHASAINGGSQYITWSLLHLVQSHPSLSSWTYHGFMIFDEIHETINFSLWSLYNGQWWTMGSSEPLYAKSSASYIIFSRFLTRHELHFFINEWTYSFNNTWFLLTDNQRTIIIYQRVAPIRTSTLQKTSRNILSSNFGPLSQWLQCRPSSYLPFSCLLLWEFSFLP